MKFLIQTVDKKIVHDFSFTLLESIRYLNWLSNSKDHIYKLSDTPAINQKTKRMIPVGSVEFVSEFIKVVYDKDVKPINVPCELYPFAKRKIFNGTEKDVTTSSFIKSMDKIKSITGIHVTVPEGRYQISDIIDIESEYRCFVYENKLAGIQNYSGDFTMFPCITTINEMINSYKSAPIAYTLDVGISKKLGTFVIEVHDFFSCGLYGFSNHKIYPYMLVRWFNQFIKK